MNIKDLLSFLALPYADLPTRKMNNLDDPPQMLSASDPGNNNPDTWTRYLSKLATSAIIPLLVPTATALAGWYANRRHLAQVKQNEALKEELTQIREDIRQGQIQAAAYPTDKPDKKQLTAITREEEEELDQINRDLAMISDQLQRRQDIYCSRLTSRKNRHKIEEGLKEFAFSKPYDKDLRLYSGLIDIFRYENHCDRYGPHENGCMMWVYLDMWRTMARLRMHQRVDTRLQHEGRGDR